MNRQALIILTVVGIFISGIVAGWFLRPVLGPSPLITEAHKLPTPSATIASLDARLHFTEEQKRALEPIVKEWAAVARAAEMPMRKIRFEAFLSTSPRIRALLTPDQQLEYDVLAESVRQKHEARTTTAVE